MKRAISLRNFAELRLTDGAIHINCIWLQAVRLPDALGSSALFFVVYTEVGRSPRHLGHSFMAALANPVDCSLTLRHQEFKLVVLKC